MSLTAEGVIKMRRIKDLMAQQAAQHFVGREHEIAALMHFLDTDRPLVIHVHGIAGIGKSSLLETFTNQAREQGATAIRLDCREIEPTEQGFLRELGAAIGSDLATPGEAAERLRHLGERVVLALDTYEVFRMLDTWLRQSFVPALYENVRIFLFGREPPVSAWQVSPGWEGLFKSIRLDPLQEDDAIRLLGHAGISQSDALRINRFARGHPLALRLAAAAIGERPDLQFDQVASQHVIAELTRIYLADVRDPVARNVLDAASAVRRTTKPLLAALLPDIAPQDAYDRLAGLPFVERAMDGLIMHEAVQQANAASLRASDPDRYCAYRLAAWRHLRGQIGAATTSELWRYTADLVYLVETPIIREAFFPSNLQPYAVEPALPDDGPAIREITARHEGPAAAGALLEWWDRAPHTFRAVRDQSGALAGYYMLFDPAEVPSSLLHSDPLAHAWWQHLQDHPMPEGQQALFLRRWLDAEVGEAPSQTQAACWLDLKASYLALRPVLRRLYCTAVDARTYAPVLLQLRFQLVPEGQVTLDGRTYQCAMLDFGPGLFYGWLTSLVGLELGVEQGEVLDVDARELVIYDRRVGLTPLEFSVMHYLCQHEGEAVSRITLLEDVWGYDYTGGSNVVDARIWALRRKLGELGPLIETVPGIGYRFRRG
jgi:hypothetical protein